MSIANIPLPWRAVGATVQAGSVADGNHTVVVITTDDIGHDETEALMRLVSAAPELLTALEVAEGALREYPQLNAIARAAIAKARGQ